MTNFSAFIRIISYVIFFSLFLACGSVAEELKITWAKHVGWIGSGLCIFLIANYSKSAIEFQERVFNRRRKLIWNGWLPTVIMGLALFFVLLFMAIDGRTNGAL